MKVIDILTVLGDMDDELIEESDISDKKRPRKWIIAVGAAACLLISVCGGIFALQYFHYVPMESNVSSTSGYQEYSLIQTLERKQIYGQFALSQRSEDELIKIFPNKNTDSIYEDDRYFYSFDDNGRLLEMTSAYSDAHTDAVIEESAVRERVSEIFELYLPDLNISEYHVNIDYTNGLKVWNVNAEKKDKNIIVSTVTITLYADGDINLIMAERTDDNMGKINGNEALSIALDRLLEKTDELTIRASTGKENGTVYYQFVFDYPTVYDDGKTKKNTVQIKVDAETGKIIEDLTFQYTE